MQKFRRRHQAQGRRRRIDPKVEPETVAGVMANLICEDKIRTWGISETDEGIDANQQLLALVQNMAQHKSATSAQISLAWMMCKKPYIVPIPGTRKLERMQENAGAAQVKLTEEEVAALDRLLDQTETSGVFGGSRVRR
ncbi:MAG: aldo/keto reductase [Coriobacteriia bacterium]|nr:aldo/keto reductase [Coriobacteriia bacterium]